jgi:hypothetical protein
MICHAPTIAGAQRRERYIGSLKAATDLREMTSPSSAPARHRNGGVLHRRERDEDLAWLSAVRIRIQLPLPTFGHSGLKVGHLTAQISNQLC